MLEGTFLDLGPELWAVVIIVALIVIEIFQLGPHSFEWKKRKTGGGGAPSSRDSKGGGKKPGFKGSNNGRQRRRKNKFGVLKDKSISEYILVNAPCAFLFIFPRNDEDFDAGKLVPKFNSAAAASTLDNSGMVYPEKIEAGNNYTAAHGEESEVSVLDTLEGLITANEEVGHICLFSSTIPSVFALQRLVELKKKCCDELPKKVEVSVLYEELDDQVDGDAERLEEKQQFLHLNNVSLERVALL